MGHDLQTKKSRPKDQGGLEIEVLEMKNKCLLSKWLLKLLTEEGI
jgi:hypothetical protein